MFSAHWTYCPYIQGVVYACLSFLLSEELDGVQTRALVEPYSQHGAPWHRGHDRERVVEFVASYGARVTQAPLIHAGSFEKLFCHQVEDVHMCGIFACLSYYAARKVDPSA